MRSSRSSAQLHIILPVPPKTHQFRPKLTNSAHDAHDWGEDKHETDHDTSEVDACNGVEDNENVGVC